MTPAQIVDITISNISKELVNYILLEITIATVNVHFNTDYFPEGIYKYIYLKDGNKELGC